MARHRRTPKKNRNKLKSVDPFNRNGRAILRGKLSKLNRAPTSDEMDTQPMPRASKNMLELKSAAAAVVEKKTKRRNRLIEETERIGIAPRRHETQSRFMHRITRDTHYDVQEELMKVHFGLAGRSEKEVEADYQQLQAESTSKQRKIDKTKKTTDAKGGAAATPDTVVKSNRKERQRLLRRDDRECESKELLLSAREIIPFGERVDAPPDLQCFRPKANTSNSEKVAKAGSRRLLLTNLLSKTNNGDEQPTGQFATKSRPTMKLGIKVLAAERAQVIESYRSLKRQQRLNQMTTI